MNRMTNWCASLLLMMAPLAFGQEQQTPQPQDALGAQQLIAWSWLQKPQPAPQPLPPRDTPLPQPDPRDQQAKPPANPQDQTPTQSFTGKILKDAGKYVLRVAGHTTYQLDGQDSLKQYENQDVKVIGSLDTATNTIRIVKIELMS
jgi:hypothetical protein